MLAFVLFFAARLMSLALDVIFQLCAVKNITQLVCGKINVTCGAETMLRDKRGRFDIIDFKTG
jgi:hypothetical protein